MIRRLGFAPLAALALVSGAGLMLRAEPPQEVGTWASIGAAPENRIGAAAVALADGRTLMAGGLANGTPTAAVVVFDPANGSFAAVGQLLEPRAGHTATLLEDGRVLIAGGTVNEVLSGVIEIFDPSTGTSTPAATMAELRTGHAAARIGDGKVLIVGGTGTHGVRQTAEIFDPATGTVSLTTSAMNSGRTGASATTLIDGRVLIVGGSNGSQDLASAEIYNPFTDSFQVTSTNLGSPRINHTAVLLPYNNSVLIAGGSRNGSPLATADLFLPAQFPDPFSYGMGQFVLTGQMAAPRSGAAGGPHIEGYAFVVGGGQADAEVYRFPTIKTDKDDYAPGQTAIITGSGWQPNQYVTLLFQEDPAVHTDYMLTVIADGQGNIYHDRWAPEQHDLNVRFYLLAEQTTAQGDRRAQTTFTDAELVTAELTPLVNDVTVTQGSSTNFTISLSATGSISSQITAASPSKAKVKTSYALNSGVLTSGSFSGDFNFFSSGMSCSGQNCDVTWTGASTPYSVSASISADALTPVGNYTITLSEAAGTTSTTDPTAQGGKLDDNTATTITVHVVAAAAGHIIVDKVTDPSGDPQSFDFTVTGTGYSPFSLTDAAAANDQTLVPGTYSVSETAVAGWELTSSVCSDGSPITAIALAAGETVTCTFTNTKRGHIIVDKVTDPSGDPQSFDFTVTGTGYSPFSLTDAAAANDQTLKPGTYSVSETAVAGWDLTSSVCSDGSPVNAIVLGVGETVTCTFTNTKRGHIIVDKVALPSGDPQSFSFVAGGSGYANFNLTDAAAPNNQMLVPGTYSISETVPAGWDQTGAVCSDGSPINAIALAAGETVTCTFTNTKRGKVTIQKLATPAVGTFFFTLTGPTGPWNFSLGNLGVYTTPLVPAGPGYAATETAVPGWATSTSCDSGIVSNIVVPPGGVATCTFTNANPPPTASITGPLSGLNVFPVGTTVNLTGTFTDSYLDMHTFVWMFDALSTSAAAATPNPGDAGSTNTSYPFTVPGVYSVKLIVTDGAGQSAVDTTTPDGLPAMVIVYDPNGGFVTGGGWIDSPAGAYSPDPSLGGKATFGFVSKYKKGATAPTGETEFQFKAGDLNFHSTAYQWLVVAGAKAQYKGEGTINGVAGYSFLLTATDGQVAGGGGVDKFRIKIWNTLTSDIVYDNNVGGSDDIDLANPQALGGGSIVIHK